MSSPQSTADPTKAALHFFLRAQRECVVEIIKGLTAEQLIKPVTPSRWTPLGMIEHLGYAERHWFQEIMLGTADTLAWPDDDHEPLTTPRPPDVVFRFYADQCARSDEVIMAKALDAPIVQRHPGQLGEETTKLRTVILHMIEETARHAGHLDIARELLDGTTGLAPR